MVGVGRFKHLLTEKLADRRCIHTASFVASDVAVYSAPLVDRAVVVAIFGYGVKPSETNKPRMCNIAHALSK